METTPCVIVSDTTTRIDVNKRQMWGFLPQTLRNYVVLKWAVISITLVVY